MISAVEFRDENDPEICQHTHDKAVDAITVHPQPELSSCYRMLQSVLETAIDPLLKAGVTSCPCTTPNVSRRRTGAQCEQCRKCDTLCTGVSSAKLQAPITTVPQRAPSHGRLQSCPSPSPSQSFHSLSWLLLGDFSHFYRGESGLWNSYDSGLHQCVSERERLAERNSEQASHFQSSQSSKMPLGPVLMMVRIVVDWDVGEADRE